MAKKWYQYVGVKAAIIIAVGSIIVAGMNIWHDRSEIKQNNEEYRNEIKNKNNLIDELNQQLSQKNSEIQRLETQLVPYKIVDLKNQSFVANIAKITQLGNLSLWNNKYGGHRQSYEDLLSWKNNETDPKIKNQISIEIKTIQSTYSPDILTLWIERPIAICKFITEPNVRPCDWGFESPTGYDAKNVFNHLTRPLWTERARAACLLRNIKTAQKKDQINKEELYDKLVALMKKENENSLFVNTMALYTYAELTRFSPSEIFDFEGAIKDWEKPERKEEILKNNF